RMNEAIELRREYHVDEYDRQKDSDTEIIRGLSQLLRASGEDHRVPRFHIQFGSLLSYCSNGFAQRNAVETGKHLNISLAVVALNPVRTAFQFELGHIAQLDDALCRRWNQQIVEM